MLFEKQNLMRNFPTEVKMPFNIVFYVDIGKYS